jgi:hypothetical protein
MSAMKRTVLPIVPAAVWIVLSEFVRNQLLFRSYWVEHYAKLGLAFPEKPVNGALWGLWSLLFAVTVFILAKRFTLIQTAALAWFVGFVLMWVVIGNLGVLPFGLLVFAAPLSMLEAFLAAVIVKKLASSRENA